MPSSATAQAKIKELQEQIELLKNTAILELRERRVQLAQELHEVDCEIARLTGKGVGTQQRTRRTSGRIVSLQELKDLLSGEPGKTLSLRGSGIEAKNVKRLAEANPSVLKVGGAGAWPTVTLLR